MKKIAASLLFLALCVPAFSGCNYINEDLKSSLPDETTNIVDLLETTRENTPENVISSTTNNSVSIGIDKIAKEIQDKLFHPFTITNPPSLNHVPEPFRSVLTDEKTFYSVRYQKETFLSDYTCSYARKKYLHVKMLDTL